VSLPLGCSNVRIHFPSKAATQKFINRGIPPQHFGHREIEFLPQFFDGTRKEKNFESNCRYLVWLTT
jgi:hypothetical protein